MGLNLKQVGNVHVEAKHNVACLENINPLHIAEIVTNDGVNHPVDR